MLSLAASMMDVVWPTVFHKNPTGMLAVVNWFAEKLVFATLLVSSGILAIALAREAFDSVTPAAEVDGVVVKGSWRYQNDIAQETRNDLRFLAKTFGITISGYLFVVGLAMFSFGFDFFIKSEFMMSFVDLFRNYTGTSDVSGWCRNVSEIFAKALTTVYAPFVIYILAKSVHRVIMFRFYYVEPPPRKDADDSTGGKWLKKPKRDQAVSS